MEDNLGVGVVTSSNLKERYTACKNVWLKDFSHTYLFGGDGEDENLISISPAGEDYSSHFLKQQLGFKHMYEDNPNYDWYIMTSCDAILFKNKTMVELTKYDPTIDLVLCQPCGYWTDVPHIHEGGVNNTTFQAIAGGGGIFVSNSLMKKCYNIIDEFNELWKNVSGCNYSYSDVAFGYMLKKYFNIDLTHELFILGQHPSHYESDESIKLNNYDSWFDVKLHVKTPMSLHYIKPHEMEEIYKKYNI